MTLRAISGSMLLPVMVCAVGVAPLRMRAQVAAAMGPPKVLYTTREFVKPGKGAAHQKTEAAAAAALAAAKGSMYYLTMFSITGEPRVVSLAGYDTMAEVEDRYLATMKIPGLVAKLDAVGEQDGELVSSEGSAIWRMREDLSSPSTVNIAEMRMAQLVQVETKPGHGTDFETVAKRVIGAWAKTDPGYSAAVYEMAYGHSTGAVFLVILPMKSMAYLDKVHDEHDAFVKALGAEDLKGDREIAKNAYLSSESNLFVFSPRMSYAPEAWVKADPAFWKPKAMMMPMKKAADAK
jgi:hypothetical protein